MNFENYTQKSLEAVRGAQQLAVQNGHPEVSQLHLLAALLGQEGGLIPQLLRKMGLTVESLEAAVMSELNKLPRVSGSREADKIYITADLDGAFTAARSHFFFS